MKQDLNQWYFWTLLHNLNLVNQNSVLYVPSPLLWLVCFFGVFLIPFYLILYFSNPIFICVSFSFIVLSWSVIRFIYSQPVLMLSVVHDGDKYVVRVRPMKMLGVSFRHLRTHFYFLCKMTLVLLRRYVSAKVKRPDVSHS